MCFACGLIVGVLGSLTDEEEAKHLPLVREHDGAVCACIDSARATGVVGRVSEFGARLRQVVRRNGLFKAKVAAVLSDGAPWIRISCEEIFAGRKVIFILELFHALTCAAAAQALTPDKCKQKLWMDWIKEQSNAAG